MAASPRSTDRPPASQTLSRGIQIVERLAESSAGLTIDEVARELDVHRSIAYRLLRTLMDHGLVVRGDEGRMELGPRVAALAAGVSRDLQLEALPELRAVADDLGMTCFLVVLDGESCVTLVSAMPRHCDASVAQRPGARHPVTVGAPGRAILSLLPRADWPTAISPKLGDEVRSVVADGFATSHDEVIPAVRSVAVPLALRNRRPAAVAVVHLGAGGGEKALAARLQSCAESIRRHVDG